jgi:hypothetical protein
MRKKDGTATGEIGGAVMERMDRQWIQAVRRGEFVGGVSRRSGGGAEGSCFGATWFSAGWMAAVVDEPVADSLGALLRRE